FVIGLSLWLFSCPISADETYGNIMVKSDQPGAMVSLDGFTNTFATPYEFYGIKTGRHTVKVTKPGYRMYINNDVVVSPGMTTQVYAPLLKDPDYGTIKVLTFPEGAEVIVDGIPRGKTPIAQDKSSEPTHLVISGLSDGAHTVVIKRDGYADITRTVTTGAEISGPVVISENLVQVKPVQTTQVTTVPPTVAPVQTSPPVHEGTLSIVSSPSGAQVMMNRTIKGITPLTLQNLPVGAYDLTLELAGHTPVIQRTEIKAGQVTNLSVTLLPVPTSVAATPSVSSPVSTPVPTKTQKSPLFATLPAVVLGLFVFGALKRK
ncbi:PEGA domain-containing protein, partial [Methanospirillum hungatei]|uniref:PEGA domain-containing protein n=1 Tax=Methanospirillum hungatei TaxID=2203 RepID=UPI0026EC40D8